MPQKTVFAYIYMIELAPTGKTKKWLVKNKKVDSYLGDIAWHNHWRQYCFFPSCNTVFSQGCLSDINQFILEAMHEHKNKSVPNERL